MVSSTLWIRVNKQQILELTSSVAGLVEGNEYEVRVAAENRAGVGEFSPPSAPFLAKDPWQKPGKPGRPNTDNVTGHGLDLAWAAPESDGGAEIFNYLIDYRSFGELKWQKYSTTEPQPETCYKIEKLRENTEYEFRVAAENRAGVGPYSDPSEPARTRIVGEAPVLVSALKDVTVTSPETASFECQLQVSAHDSDQLFSH